MSPMLVPSPSGVFSPAHALARLAPGVNDVEHAPVERLLRRRRAMHQAFGSPGGCRRDHGWYPEVEAEAYPWLDGCLANP